MRALALSDAEASRLSAVLRHLRSKIDGYDSTFEFAEEITSGQRDLDGNLIGEFADA